jgi:deoxyribodipyrimidine photolyase-related protein
VGSAIVGTEVRFDLDDDPGALDALDAPHKKLTEEIGSDVDRVASVEGSLQGLHDPSLAERWHEWIEHAFDPLAGQHRPSVRPTAATTLRLVLGDQLHAGHSWYARPDPEVLYIMMEVREETDTVAHHAQKIIALFAAMRTFALQLREGGHCVAYLRIGAPGNAQSIARNLGLWIERLNLRRLEWQSPDEWRVDQSLAELARLAPIETAMVDSEHFFFERGAVAELFRGKKRWLQESFYRHARSTHGILLCSDGSPLGGRWNFDTENRRAWKGEPRVPSALTRRHDHSALWDEVVKAGVQTIGAPSAENISWPRDRSEALCDLRQFIEERLVHFGDYQDAMAAAEPTLFHARLSFALNVKLLGPAEVVRAAEEALRQGRAGLPAVEGFIRQILGWREYIRGVYWARMPAYAQSDYFEHREELPEWFWTGQTGMRCLSVAIGQSLAGAYAHHIQRLMLTGNIALLLGVSARAIERWYLAIYIDAFEWVEMPNTLGMSQFADGGLLATKPYVASAAYIDRMSDYCAGCRYDRKQRLGPKACPFNALYWDFFLRHRARLGGLARLALVYRNLDRMSENERADLTEKAVQLRERAALL